jgi:hypothetical protein
VRLPGAAVARLRQVDLGNQAIGQMSDLSTSHQSLNFALKQHL